MTYASPDTSYKPDSRPPIDPMYPAGIALGSILFALLVMATIDSDDANKSFRQTLPRAVEVDGFTVDHLKHLDFERPVARIALNQECSFNAELIADTNSGSGNVKDIISYTLQNNHQQITVANAEQLVQK